MSAPQAWKAHARNATFLGKGRGIPQLERRATVRSMAPQGRRTGGAA